MATTINGRMRQFGVAVSVAVLAVACGKSPTAPSGTGGGSGSGGGAAATVASVKISGNLTPSQGSTSQLTATATMSDGTTQNVTTQATWRSSNPSVASVSSTGVVTAQATGTVDVTATYQAQTGKATVQVRAATFAVEVDVQSVTALDTCDDVTQGLGNGEFAVRVLAVLADGSQFTMSQTTGYPGNPKKLKVFELGRNQSQSLGSTRTFTLPGQAGQSVRLQFSATEWDQQIVVFPPSTRWVPDSHLNNRSASRTHAFSNDSFTGLGPNTLTVGNSSCGMRLNYTVRATRQ